MKNTVLRVWMVALAILVVGLVTQADMLEMRDGRVIQGKYMGGTQHNIRFEKDGKIELYPVSDVAAVTLDQRAPAASAAPATAPHPASRPATASTAPPSSSSAGLQRRPSAITVPAGTVSSARSLTVPAGTRLMVRMIDGVNSDTNRVGDRFHASLIEDLVVDGVTVAPRGADVYGRLVEAREAGRIQGQSELRLELSEIMLNNRLYNIQTGDYQVEGESRGKDTVKKGAGGAAIGAIIGAIAGGGKGAAIGAGVGSAAGVGTQVITRGQKVSVPPETVLEFTVQQPFVVPVTAS